MIVHDPGHTLCIFLCVVCSLSFVYDALIHNTLAGTPFELFFQYYPYLLQRIHPSDVMKEMLCHKMLSKSDCKIIKNVPISNHMRNHIMMLNYVYNKEMSCLFMFLEILQQIDSQIYAVLSNGIATNTVRVKIKATFCN